MEERDARPVTNSMNLCEEFILILRFDGTTGFITALAGLETKNSLAVVYDLFHFDYYVTLCLKLIIFFIMWF